ncbi:MAG: hypothetical protein ACREJ2_01635, partial [Planctomycetota bacterium]
MNAYRADLLHVLDLIPRDPALQTLYRQALARLDLAAVDYSTVRELCRLSGFSDLAAHTLLICMFVTLNEGSLCLALTPAAIRRRLEQFLVDDLDAVVQSVLSAAQAPAAAGLIAAAAEVPAATPAAPA